MGDCPSILYPRGVLCPLCVCPGCAHVAGKCKLYLEMSECRSARTRCRYRCNCRYGYNVPERVPRVSTLTFIYWKGGPGGEIEKGVTRIQDRQSGAVNKALNFNKLPTEARANWHHEAGRQWIDDLSITSLLFPIPIRASPTKNLHLD